MIAMSKQLAEKPPLNSASSEIKGVMNDGVTLSFGKNVKDKMEMVVLSKEFGEYKGVLTSHKAFSDKLAASYFVAAHIDGSRNKYNLVTETSRGMIVLDGDKAVVDGEIIENLAPQPRAVFDGIVELGLSCMVYTTWSHGEVFIDDDGVERTKVKWRAVILWQGKEWRKGVGWIVDALNDKGIGVVAVNEMVNEATAWFLPSYHPDRKDSVEKYSFLDGVALTQTLNGHPKHPEAFEGNVLSKVLCDTKVLGITKDQRTKNKEQSPRMVSLQLEDEFQVMNYLHSFRLLGM